VPQAGRRRPVPLAERIKRARRSGLATLVIVRPACPSCGDQRLRTHGVHGGVRYLACRGCGQQLRGVIADPSEVDVRSLDAAPPTSDSESDPIDAATLAEARRTLAGW
jgi:hypothetical protein